MGINGVMKIASLTYGGMVPLDFMTFIYTCKFFKDDVISKIKGRNGKGRVKNNGHCLAVEPPRSVKYSMRINRLN